MLPTPFFFTAQAPRAARWRKPALMALICALGWMVSLTARAQMADQGALGEKAESPYFWVTSDTANVDVLPLKSTQVDVHVTGVIADVTVVQRYKNQGQNPIEARYVFPASTQAAVYDMEVHLGDRVIRAKVSEKQQAQHTYDAAKKAGKTAALLEQHRPNVFQMNVANILPGDDVLVTLRYTELLVPQAGQYQFVFPTVVGPRYQGAAEGKAKAAQAVFAQQGYLPEGEASPSAFDVQVTLQAPVALKAVQSSSHAVQVAPGDAGETSATVTLQPGKGTANNRDFILSYRLAGDHIASGVMLHKDPRGGENYFLAMVQPPKQPAVSTINPREYVFVMDISGSMRGFPLDTAKVLLRELIGGLRPTDRFNVLLFAGSNQFLSPGSVPASQANIDRAIATIDAKGGGGGTELIPALKRVYGQPKDSDTARTIVVVTDGFVSVEQEAFELVRNNLSSANLFAFGIGSSVNRHLMEGLARAGMGEPFIVTNATEAPAAAQRLRQMIEAPVLTSIKTQFTGLDVYDVEPTHLPDVLSERPVLMFGKWRGKPSGDWLVEGRSGQQAYAHATPLQTEGDHYNPALRYLWARHRIATLSDQETLEGGNAQRAAITALGLEHQLLTPYTSFVAIDEVVRNKQPAASTSVHQPLPLPQGVSHAAVGVQVPGTPEPAAWAAILVLLPVLTWLSRRRLRAVHPARSA